MPPAARGFRAGPTQSRAATAPSRADKTGLLELEGRAGTGVGGSDRRSERRHQAGGIRPRVRASTRSWWSEKILSLLYTLLRCAYAVLVLIPIVAATLATVWPRAISRNTCASRLVSSGRCCSSSRPEPAST